MKKIIFSLLFIFCQIVIFAQPSWSPVNYTNSTTAYGIVTIEGGAATSSDIVAAFVNGECRAVGNVVVNSNVAYITLVIQGEATENVSFKVWDADDDIVLEATTTVQSSPGNTVGYPPNYLNIDAVSNTCSDPFDDVVNYTNSTTVYGIVSINNTPATESDIVAAYVDSECRAKGTPAIFEGASYITLVVQGESVEKIEFRVWDASECKTYINVLSENSDPGNSIGYPPGYLKINATDNNAPVANAGDDQYKNEGETVTLDGTGSSDTDGDEITYHWAAPEGISLQHPATAQPTFALPENAQASYQFILVVNDGILNSSPDTVMVYVNRKPIANAGDDQIVDAGQQVNLDGSNSSDPDGDPLTYKWKAINDIALEDTGNVVSKFVAPSLLSDSNFIFLLKVNDGQLSSDYDTVTVTVRKDPTSIHTHSINEVIKIYPNPAKHILQITALLGQNINRIKIYNSCGQYIFSGNRVENSKNCILDLNGYTPGLYYLNVYLDNGEVSMQKLIIN